MPVQRSNGSCVPVANPLFLHCCALFAHFASLLLFVFNGLRALLPKHPGYGYLTGPTPQLASHNVRPSGLQSRAAAPFSRRLCDSPWSFDA